MFCLKCGELIPDESQVCPKCGENPREEINQGQAAIVYATPEAGSTSANTSVGKKSISKKAWIVMGAMIAVAALVFIINSVQASNLKKILMKEWYASSDSIIQVLEFDDDEAEYRLETGYLWMDTTLFTEDYKVISGDTFKIQRFGDEWETYKVEFNDDKTIMTVSPAITSTDSTETWVDIGY